MRCKNMSWASRTGTPPLWPGCVRRPQNSATLVERYRQLLTDFAKDWRELWYQFGYQRDGIARYRELIESVRRQLHPDRRALVTASNDVGVNPIIVQRILNAALAPEELERFSGPA